MIEPKEGDFDKWNGAYIDVIDCYIPNFIPDRELLDKFPPVAGFKRTIEMTEDLRLRFVYTSIPKDE